MQAFRQFGDLITKHEEHLYICKKVIKIMKNAMFLLFVSCTLLMAGCKKDPVEESKTGTFNDSRDQHLYKWVKIGTQTWMAENLAYLPAVSYSSDGSETTPFYYVYDYEGTSVVAAKTKPDYATYGVLYNWVAASTACPMGWHLPSDAEWSILTDYLTINGFGYGGSGNDISKSMGSAAGWTAFSLTGTIGNNQSTNNSSGFTAIPGGYRYYNKGFYDLGTYAEFWSSTQIGSTAWYRALYYNNDGATRKDFNRGYGFSVRCLKD